MNSRKLLKNNIKNLFYNRSSQKFHVSMFKGDGHLEHEDSLMIDSSELSGKVFLDFFLPKKASVSKIVNSLKKIEKSLSLGYFSQLSLRGIGFKCYFLSHSKILLSLGYSHYIIYSLPSGVLAFIKKGKIFLYSLDSQLLGISLSNFKNFRIPDAYKAKGIIEDGQLFSLKEGKKR